MAISTTIQINRATPTANAAIGARGCRNHANKAAASGPIPRTQNRISPGVKYVSNGEPLSADTGSGIISPLGPSIKAPPPSAPTLRKTSKNTAAFANPVSERVSGIA